MSDCPNIVQDREGTSYCRLAQATGLEVPKLVAQLDTLKSENEALRKSLDHHQAEANRHVKEILDQRATLDRLKSLEAHHNLCRAEAGAPDDDVLLEAIKELRSENARLRDALEAARPLVKAYLVQKEVSSRVYDTTEAERVLGQIEEALKQ